MKLLSADDRELRGAVRIPLSERDLVLIFVI